MGMWIEYEELYNHYGGPLAENSPPNAGVGVILLLMIIGGVLYKFRKSLRLKAAELVFIYTALLVAAPLMTQGMWHRIFGLMAGIPHEQDFKSYESLPPMLWPHGDNLIVNGRFLKGLDGYEKIGKGAVTWEKIGWKGNDWKSPVLSNGEMGQGTTSLKFTVPVKKPSGEGNQLVPGENFIISCLVKADGFQSTSSYFIKVQADDGPIRNVILSAAGTSPSFANPSGFQRVGVCPFTIPTDLKEKLTFYVGINGPGTLALQDIELINSQAVEGAYTGRKVVRESNLSKLGAHERDFTVVKPDNMFSFAGLKYLVTGFIPLDQWVRPAIAWSILIGALFLGFLGFNVLMRRQWVESERFTFPMNILPRQLFAAEDGEGGIQSIFRNPVMWVGFGITFVLVMLKGIHYYYPAVPAPVWEEMRTAEFVTSPALKAYLGNVWISVIFTLLAIALLVETDILFSIWASFLLWQLFPLFGKIFSFNRFVGYPYEVAQSVGAFIAFAFLALIVSRRHLLKVAKHVLG